MLPLYEGGVPCQPLTTRFVHLLRILGFESTEECSRRAEASLQRDFAYRKMHREQPPERPDWMETIKLLAEVFLNTAIESESPFAKRKRCQSGCYVLRAEAVKEKGHYCFHSSLAAKSGHACC